MNRQLLRCYDFGPFRLNATDKLLHRSGRAVPLTPKLVDTLVVLVENSGHVVTKEELMEALWPNSFVEESSLTQNISLLRKALTDNGTQYIETIPKRGYRFVAVVREVNGAVDDAVLQEALNDQTAVDRQTENTATVPVSPAERSVVRNAVFSRVARRKVYLGLVSACLILISVAAVYLARRSRKANEAFVPKSIAVLPFRTIGFDTDSELIGLGMADAVVLKLTRLNRTTVVPTSSVSRYGNRDKDVLTIARELGVDAVLDGTVQRDGDRVRVTALLIRTRNGRTFWSGKFDESYTDTFALQESISTLLTSELVPSIEAPDKRTAKRLTENAEAYRAYTSGLYFWNKRGKDNLQKATTYLEESVAKDSGFALAHAILADCYYLSADGDLGILPRQEALTRASNEATKALELDGSLAEAHTVRAGLAIIGYDFGTAECEYLRAIQLNPNCALAHLRYSYLLLGQGKLQDAVAQIQQAHDLDPVSPLSNTARGLMLYMSRDYDGAIKAHQKALELQPDLNQARANLALAYASKGMFREASAEFEALRNRDALLAAKAEIFSLGLAGRTADARQRLSELQRSITEKQITPYDYVVLYSALGDKDKAFEWLEKVDVKGYGRLKFDPELDLLRGDVRFAQFLSRLQTTLIHPPGES